MFRFFKRLKCSRLKRCIHGSISRAGLLSRNIGKNIFIYDNRGFGCFVIINPSDITNAAKVLSIVPPDVRIVSPIQAFNYKSLGEVREAIKDFSTYDFEEQLNNVPTRLALELALDTIKNHLSHTKIRMSIEDGAVVKTLSVRFFSQCSLRSAYVYATIINEGSSTFLGNFEHSEFLHPLEVLLAIDQMVSKCFNNKETLVGMKLDQLRYDKRWLCEWVSTKQARRHLFNRFGFIFPERSLISVSLHEPFKDADFLSPVAPKIHKNLPDAISDRRIVEPQSK